jgi:hypothetical protein
MPILLSEQWFNHYMVIFPGPQEVPEHENLGEYTDEFRFFASATGRKDCNEPSHVQLVLDCAIQRLRALGLRLWGAQEEADAAGSTSLLKEHDDAEDLSNSDLTSMVALSPHEASESGHKSSSGTQGADLGTNVNTNSPCRDSKDHSCMSPSTPKTVCTISPCSVHRSDSSSTSSGPSMVRSTVPKDQADSEKGGKKDTDSALVYADSKLAKENVLESGSVECEGECASTAGGKRKHEAL